VAEAVPGVLVFDERGKVGYELPSVVWIKAGRDIDNPRTDESRVYL